MARRKHPVTTNDNMTKLNRIKPVTNVLFNLLFLLLALSADSSIRHPASQ